MTNQDYKNFIETEILKGIIFNEDSYNVDAGEHFELAPNDIVTLDVGSYGKKVITDMKAFKNAKHSQVEIDDTTNEVTINGQPLQSDSSGGSSQAGGETGGQKMEPQTRSNVVDFLKLLKANGALDKLKDLDPATKQKIAGEILKLIQGGGSAQPQAADPAAQQATPAAMSPEETKALDDNMNAAKNLPNGPHPDEIENLKKFTTDNGKKYKTKEEFLNAYKATKPDADFNNQNYTKMIMNAWTAVNGNKDFQNVTQMQESEMWLLKESFIILFELDASNVAQPGADPTQAGVDAAIKKKEAGATATPQPAAPPEAGNKPPVADPAAKPEKPPADPKADKKEDPKAGGIDPNATLGQLEKSNPTDPKVAHYIKLKNNYLKLAKIFGNSINPGSTVLAKVKQPDGKGMVSVVRMKKKGTDQTGKSTYETDADAEAFDVPVTNDVVKKRMPVEQAKKTGLLARIFGG